MNPGARTGNPYAPWWSHNIAVFDVETTGLGETDRIVEVGLARFENGEPVAEWGSLVHPRMEIPQEATNIHGISNEDVASAPHFVGTLPGILRISRDAWPAAYNADFDKRFWTQEMGRLTLSDITVPIFDPSVRWLDPLVWIRDLEGNRGGNKLTMVCKRWGIVLDNAHRATADAVAAGRVLMELRNRLPPWTMTELLRRQQELFRKQDDERRAWFAKMGRPYT